MYPSEYMKIRVQMPLMMSANKRLSPSRYKKRLIPRSGAIDLCKRALQQDTACQVQEKQENRQGQQSRDSTAPAPAQAADKGGGKGDDEPRKHADQYPNGSIFLTEINDFAFPFHSS